MHCANPSTRPPVKNSRINNSNVDQPLINEMEWNKMELSLGKSISRLNFEEGGGFSE